MGSPEFCSDVVFEFLTRIKSLKTLDTCKLVSKEWKKMIYESSFTSVHGRRTKIVSGYFIQDMIHNRNVSKFVSDSDSNNVPLEIRPKKAKILACASNQGILCCEKQVVGRQCRYYVCVPVTGECRALPNPKTRYRTAATAVVVLRSQPLRFKIIRLSEGGFMEPFNNLYKYRIEIFDSETRAWEKGKDDHVMLPYKEHIMDSNPAVFATNCVHWLTHKANVVSYNVANNSFQKFPLPKHVKDNIGSCESQHLTEYEGKLGFTCLMEKGLIGLWIMDDIKTHSWKKQMSVNIEFLEQNLTYPWPVGFQNSHIAILTAFKEVVFYFLQDCSIRRVKLDKLYDAREIFRFRSDIDPADLVLL